MPDMRLVGGGQNELPIVAAHIKRLLRANALAVVLVNASGDVYNAGGGSSGGPSSDVNLIQLNGVTIAVNAGAADNGTQRVILATDQATLPVSFPGGISVGAVTVPVGISGDVSTKPAAGHAWPVREQAVLGVQLVGSGIQVGI